MGRQMRSQSDGGDKEPQPQRDPEVTKSGEGDGVSQLGWRR